MRRRLDYMHVRWSPAVVHQVQQAQAADIGTSKRWPSSFDMLINSMSSLVDDQPSRLLEDLLEHGDFPSH